MNQKLMVSGVVSARFIPSTRALLATAVLLLAATRRIRTTVAILGQSPSAPTSRVELKDSIIEIQVSVHFRSCRTAL